MLKSKQNTGSAESKREERHEIYQDAWNRE